MNEVLQHKFVSKELIDKGWSGDKKYCVTDKQGNKYLFRVSPIELYERKKSEYELMTKVATLGIPMCRPLEFGTSDEGVYSIQTWIDGTDAEEVIPYLTDSEQYSYGFEAGRMLRSIHSISDSDNRPDWELFFNGKIDRKINTYKNCPIHFAGDESMIDYIESNRYLLKDRPQCLQHGDYHRGNLMVDSNGTLTVIDFGKVDFGDPWEDMKAITWDIGMSPLFATGRINGYFNNNVPIEFWQLLALYICVGSLSSIPWAIPFGDEQIQVMVNQAKDVLSWYDDMKNSVPTWYKGVISK